MSDSIQQPLVPVVGDGLHTPSPERTLVRYTNFLGGRTYVPHQQGYPSVTTVIGILSKPALVDWAGRLERAHAIATSAGIVDRYTAAGQSVPSGELWVALLERELGSKLACRRAVGEASRIGNAVHERIEWELRRELGIAPRPGETEPALTTEAEQWAFLVWQEWRQGVDLRPLGVEFVLRSDAYRYAGTIDLLAVVDGREAVVDFKTSTGIYIEGWIQNAAYRAAAREMGLTDTIPDGYVIRLPKTLDGDRPEVVSVTDYDTLWRLFVALREAYEGLAAWQAAHPPQRRR